MWLLNAIDSYRKTTLFHLPKGAWWTQNGTGGFLQVIGVEKLRRRYTHSTEKRALADSFDLFLCDKRVFKSMRELLGSAFFKQKLKFPVPVLLKDKAPDPTVDIRKAIAGTIFKLAFGPCVGVRFGRCGMSEEELAANASAVIAHSIKLLSKYGLLVQSIGMQATNSMALPVWKRPTPPGETVNLKKWREQQASSAASDTGASGVSDSEITGSEIISDAGETLSTFSDTDREIETGGETMSEIDTAGETQSELDSEADGEITKEDLPLVQGLKKKKRNVCTKLQPWHLLVCLQILHGLSECLHEASAMASFGVPPDPARIVSYFPGMSARSFSHSIFWCAFRSCTDCQLLSRNVCTKLQPWHLLVCLQSLHGLSATFQECLHEASAMASFGVPPDPARIVSYFPGMSARSFSHGIFWCAFQSLHGLSVTFQECLHEASAMASFGVPPEPARIVSYFPGMSARSFSHGIFWCASRACTDCQLLSRNVCTKLQPNRGKRVLSRMHHAKEHRSQQCFESAQRIRLVLGVPGQPPRCCHDEEQGIQLRSIFHGADSAGF
ncbi:unnamed protein product [Cladocopium goreaui]|uniref:Ribosome biogenesis protein C8F11.04 (U3 snoRNP-associated protein C8F11.04) n=1 Tax=Cladocopium goreaui TaxID=2562237 RepID=A0A9P1CLU8_9DINO|nr:unnamed protein product [Cladocopium goreaui]